MPLYEYRCEDCGVEFELRRPVGAGNDPTQCPTCTSGDVKRQVSLFMTYAKGEEASPRSGGCGCGGACSCGGHSSN